MAFVKIINNHKKLVMHVKNKAKTTMNPLIDFVLKLFIRKKPLKNPKRPNSNKTKDSGFF